MITKLNREVRDLTTVVLAFWGESVGSSHQVFHSKNSVGVNHNKYFSLQAEGWLVEQPISFELRSLRLDAKSCDGYGDIEYPEASLQFRIGDKFYGDFPLKRNGLYSLNEKEIISPYQSLNVVTTYPKYIETFYSGEIELGLYRPIH